MKKYLLTAALYILTGSLAVSLAGIFATRWFKSSSAQTSEQAPPPADGSPAPANPPEAAPPPAPPANEQAATSESAPPAPPVDPNQPPAGDAANTQPAAGDDNAQADTNATPPPMDQTVTLDVFKTTFVYDPQGKRDPFLPPDIEKPLQPVQMHGPLMPLQKYKIESLKITGILWDVSWPKAMVRDPDGKLHTVRKNDRIGTNNGYVAVIREGELVVVENVAIDGKTYLTTRVMKITR